MLSLYNLYGPTEASIDAIVYRCTNDESGSISIGKPIANMKAHVLDESYQPVPLGVKAELFLTGVNLGNGYLNLPQITKEKFVASPLTA